MRKEEKDEKPNMFKKIHEQSGLVRWWGVVDQLRSTVEGCVCVCVWHQKDYFLKDYKLD